MGGKNKKLFSCFFIFPPIVLARFFSAFPAEATVVINEIMLEGKTNTKDEFIELYNNSSSEIDLEKSRLAKKTKSGSESALVSSAKFKGKIPSRGYFLITHPDFESQYESDLVYSSSSYSIAKDNTVILYDASGTILDKVGLGDASDFESSPAQNPDKGKSVERNGEHKDTDNNSVDFTLQTKSSPTNSFGKSYEEPPPVVYSSDIIINELLPNPSGNEEEKEFIELYNPGDEKVNLKNWTLKDASSSGFVFNDSYEIASEKFLAIYRSAFGFSLNNSGGETVSLLNPDEKEVSSVSYSGSAAEDVSYNFNGEKWRWSRFLTPGEANRFNNLPAYEIKKDKTAYKNIYADFEVKVNDPDKDDVKITWDFGDNHKSYKKKTRHKYAATGKYSGSVKIFDGSETILENFSVEVKKFLERNVRIVGILPNPQGKDAENEWVLLENKSKKRINLKNWSLATGWKKLYNHVVKKDFFINPGKTKKLTRDYCPFYLNNAKNKLELRYPNGKTASKVKYKKEKIAEDETYEKIGKVWQWKGAPKKLEPEKFPAETEAAAVLLPLQEETSVITEKEKEEIRENSGKNSRVKDFSRIRFVFLTENKLKNDLPFSPEKIPGRIYSENSGYFFFPPTAKIHWAKKMTDNLAEQMNYFLVKLY